MLHFQSQGLVLDGCARCGGVWLERGKLESARRLTSETLAAVDARLGWNAGEAAVPAPSARTVLCPACNQVMKSAPDRLHREVRIDSWAACRGSWLDPGELRAIRTAPASRTQGTRGTLTAVDAWAIAEGVSWLLEIVGTILDTANN
jgi:Zn-finger nucleic acid-binding protein